MKRYRARLTFKAASIREALTKLTENFEIEELELLEEEENGKNESGDYKSIEKT